ncbi:MAG: S9 family peptidase [Sphingobacteriales bacterium]|nr:MAG: S9 family peptidase [Sphingobacteriales bacterium]
MKRIIIAGLILLQAGTIQAQNKKFTMQDAVLGLRTNLSVEGLGAPVWMNNQHTLVYQQKNVLYKIAAPKFEKETWISLPGLNQQLFGKDSLKSLPAVNWNNSKPYFTIQNDLYFIESTNDKGFTTASPVSLEKGAANIIVKDKLVAYTVDNNLYAIDDQGNKHQVTKDHKEDHIINGQSVHRNEFGINGGIFLSPDKNKVAFYRMDESMVVDYPVIDWNPVAAQNENSKYPMAGRKSHEVTLGVYDLKTRKKIFLQTGTPADQYLTCVTWSPDAKYIYIAVLNRDQNHMKLNQYDAVSGAFIKTLFEERSDKYVEPQHALVFLPNATNEFIWHSERSGFQHLYLYNTNGKLVKQLTSGPWMVNAIEGINVAANELVISAAKESAKEKHLYTVNYKSGSLKRIDAAAGVHNAAISDDGKYILDVYSNATTPRVVNMISSKGNIVKQILKAADPLKEYQRARVEEVTLAAEDGTPLFGKLIYPTDFDPNKQYPVIYYLYNGPHVQLVQNTYPASGNLWYELLAQKGYAVFTLDGRGSSNRGAAFEQAIFRQLGTLEINDHLKGVAYLKSLPFIDGNRMGVHGWSYGGFMTTSLMLRQPDVFKVGVAGGPVIDWSMYEIMYTERYMDSPQDNPKGYADNNLLTKTKNLKGKLLMIHGAQDDVVVWQHSMKFVKSCVDNGVQLDYFVYPGHAHNVVGKDRVHLMQKITDYFDLYLK